MNCVRYVEYLWYVVLDICWFYVLCVFWVVLCGGWVDGCCVDCLCGCVVVGCVEVFWCIEVGWVCEWLLWRLVDVL